MLIVEMFCAVFDSSEENKYSIFYCYHLLFYYVKIVIKRNSKINDNNKKNERVPK
jgi:hypothetical protein